MQPGLCHVTGIWQISFQNWLMKAHWQTYVMCLFCHHRDYFAAILEAKKILPTFYYGPRASPGQKICCSLAERAGPGSFMLAPAGLQKCWTVPSLVWVLPSRGVRSLKFLAPTPLLLGWINSDSETFQRLGLRLLLKRQSELSKLLSVSKRPYPVFALTRLKKRIKWICWSLQYMSVASQIMV